MDRDDGQERPCTEEEEGTVHAKERGVRELQDGAGDGHGQRYIGVGDAKLVEVVDVGQTKDHW